MFGIETKPDDDGKKGQKTEYNYFDTPDGEDITKKLWCVLKPTAMVALAAGTVDVMMHSKPKGYIATLGRYAYISLPVMGIAATFVITTNMAKNIRNKDDYMNWALGGLVSGGILGAVKGSPILGWTSGMAFAMAAMGKKYAVNNKITLIPQGHQAFGTIRYVRHDYSLTAYRAGNYTVGPVGSTGPTE